MGERSVDSTPINVVVNTSDGPLSLLVDEIGDVVEVDEDTFEPPPDTLTGLARQLLSGVYKMKDKLLLVVDMEKAVEIGDASSDVQ
jgi:purine-binding chemotaxis protein CheW